MAAEHERWLIEMFDGLGASNKDALYAQLGRLRMHLAEREAEFSEARRTLPVLKQARAEIARWRIDYNEVRPHSALGNRTPGLAA